MHESDAPNVTVIGSAAALARRAPDPLRFGAPQQRVSKPGEGDVLNHRRKIGGAFLVWR